MNLLYLLQLTLFQNTILNSVCLQSMDLSKVLLIILNQVPG